MQVEILKITKIITKENFTKNQVESTKFDNDKAIYLLT